MVLQGMLPERPGMTSSIALAHYCTNRTTIVMDGLKTIERNAGVGMMTPTSTSGGSGPRRRKRHETE